ncbi:sce7725 family protein [Agrilactobacillus yilanensis]|uniref:Sce7725 family protein n=1 Tax=Agrilactobacillus yilanensis TaxID=2485997 RepID=A0ABW4J5D9_9LACO|nr:sce7725 family protein [Agrilactobacillus yilanensis]
MTYSYMPLLRGRQFDLLALQTVLSTKPTHLWPLIEPVKDSSTLVKTLRLWLQQKQPIGLILNASVSDYALLGHKQHPIPPKILADPNLWQFAFFDSSFSKDYFTKTTHCGLICHHYRYFVQHLAQLSTLAIDCLIIPNEARFLVLAQQLPYPVIPLSDPFQREDDLPAYQTHLDELFTWQHALGQLVPKAIGFSDYSIMGRYYSEYGKPQTTQGLQLIYPDASGALRIHHFISFDDGKMGHQKEKFLDLLQQLRHFVAQQPQNNWLTPALKQLLYLHELDKNPGFGTVKKLLLTHHFELLDQILSSY